MFSLICPSLLRPCLTRALVALLIILCAAAPASATLIEGAVTDSASGEPIPRVTVRVEGLGLSMLGNDDGRYRLRLPAGDYRIRFSHIAHYAATVDLTVTDSDSLITRDIFLHPSVIELPGTRVYRRKYDPAQEIIVEAIRRKKDLLNRIRDYRFEAYTRMVIRKLKDDQADEYLVIAESQLEGWYQHPDKYKEIITARRQSANVPAEGNLLTVGEIFNFNANRIELGRQSIVSPTASDALDYYNYYLLDTVLIDGVPAFRLEIEPKNEIHPLFVGEILIADSSYSVAGVDVGFNSAFEIPFARDVHYSQRMARFENDIWMPIEIRFNGEFRVPLLPIPDMTGYYVAVLNNVEFNRGVPTDVFDEYVIEVLPEADKIDSVAWDLGALVPLTEEETSGYRHIDSVENRPPSLKRILSTSPFLLLAATASPAAYPYFHFSRVEGPYLGAAYTFRHLIPRSELYASVGHSFDNDLWQHRYSLTTELHKRSRFNISAEYRDHIARRPTIFSGGDNPTLSTLAFQVDPFDYFREKGFTIGAAIHPLPHFDLSLEYLDADQSSVPRVTDYSLWGPDDTLRSNPAVVDGRLRSLSLTVGYDSRQLIRSKGRDIPISELPYTLITARLEGADPDYIDNDFTFRRYSLELQHYRRLGGWGTSSLRLLTGASDRALPPQRYFTFDHGAAEQTFDTQIKTLGETNFTGDRVAFAYLSHNFGATLFRRSRLPLIEKIPLSLFVYGGAFWSDFRAASIKLPGEQLHAAPDWYSEIGFGLGRIPPLYFLNTYFTWQLSSYDTNRFSFTVGMGF